MKTPLTVTLATVLALSAGAASAQTYGQAQDAYRQQRQSYDNQQQDYQAQQRAYEEARVRYERDRRAYDNRWGSGAYERRYGVFAYNPPVSTYTYPYAAGSYGYDASYNEAYAPYRDNPCERRSSSNQTAGGLIGALAGAAIGSNVAARNARTEGAVLGAVVGAAVGANIGKSTARCDDSGYYYSYDQTVPYREGYYDRRGRWHTRTRSEYSYYNGRTCRLAVAPATYNGATETRYVRVCPDGSGRYRFVG